MCGKYKNYLTEICSLNIWLPRCRFYNFMTYMSRVSYPEPSAILQISRVSYPEPSAILQISRVSYPEPSAILQISRVSYPEPSAILQISRVSYPEPSAILQISRVSYPEPSAILQISRQYSKRAKYTRRRDQEQDCQNYSQNVGCMYRLLRDRNVPKKANQIHQT